MFVCGRRSSTYCVLEGCCLALWPRLWRGASLFSALFNDAGGRYLNRALLFSCVEFLEKPLPKPSDEKYVEARLLEALAEARLALEFLERGLTRNAAEKAFQAWKALLAALLRLELDKLKSLAKTEEERRWLESTAVPRSRMIALSLMLEEVGHGASLCGQIVLFFYTTSTAALTRTRLCSGREKRLPNAPHGWRLRR